MSLEKEQAIGLTCAISGMKMRPNREGHESTDATNTITDHRFYDKKRNITLT